MKSIVFTISLVLLSFVIASPESYSKSKSANESCCNCNKVYKSFREVYYGNINDSVPDTIVDYLDIYGSVLAKFVGKQSIVLEFGVDVYKDTHSGRVKVIREYLGDQTIIHAAGPECSRKLRIKNVITHCGKSNRVTFDISNPNTFPANFNEIKFDIIIDTGLCQCKNTVDAFKTMFQRMKPGGVYIIENLQTSYWDDYLGGYLATDSTVEFFKRFADLLHKRYIKSEKFYNDLSKDDLYIVEWLESISFYSDIAVIKKRNSRIESKKILIKQKYIDNNK